MTTIHLTDVQRDQFAACGMFAIDGEVIHVYKYGNRWGDKLAEAMRPVVYDEWVAPEGWHILTEPCDTCREGCDVYECCVTGGGGRAVSWDYLCDRHRSHQGFHDCNPGCCLNCVGGLPVVTLTATCPNVECGDLRVGPCSICGNHKAPRGVVTLGRFTIPALLPVKPRPNNSTEDDYPAAWITFEGQLMIVRGAREVERPTLDPAPRVGQFIAIPERVASNDAAVAS